MLGRFHIAHACLFLFSPFPNWKHPFLRPAVRLSRRECYRLLHKTCIERSQLTVTVLKICPRYLARVDWCWASSRLCVSSVWKRILDHRVKTCYQDTINLSPPLYITLSCMHLGPCNLNPQEIGRKCVALYSEPVGGRISMRSNHVKQ